MATAYRDGVRTLYRGVWYASKYEAALAQWFFEQGIEPHYNEERLLYEVPKVHTVDFAPRTAAGETVLVEAKGRLTRDERTKIREVLAAHPGLDYRLAFQNAHQKGEQMKSTPAQWATAQGITWCHGFPPEDWFE